MIGVRSFGTIRKLSSGRFQASYWHFGKQVAASTTFANRELSAITPAEVRTWHGRLSGSGLSWNTVAKSYSCFARS